MASSSQSGALGNFSQQFSNEVHARITKQMRIIGQNVVYKATSLAPRRTGALASSISYVYDEASYQLTFTVGVPYGIFVEYGTRRMMAQPYLRPALNWAAPIFGIGTAMQFSVPHIHNPILARGPGFVGGSNLTAGQRAHVRQNLKPVSHAQWHHRSGNVKRSSLNVKRYIP